MITGLQNSSSFSNPAHQPWYLGRKHFFLFSLELFWGWSFIGVILHSLTIVCLQPVSLRHAELPKSSCRRKSALRRWLKVEKSTIKVYAFFKAVTVYLSSFIYLSISIYIYILFFIRNHLGSLGYVSWELLAGCFKWWVSWWRE